jgi:uncharacterized protein YbcI
LVSSLLDRAGRACTEGTSKGSTALSQADPTSAGALNSALSNLIVRLVGEYSGRGPVRARTYAEGDLVCVVLQDTLTRGERSLVSNGEESLVLTTRRAFQSAMREEAIAGVEELTGRKVMAFMSDNHIDPDVAVECFVMEPAA